MKNLSNESLKGQVAVITGAAGAIGSEICTRLSLLGARLVLVDLRDDALRAFAAQFPADTLCIAADLSAPDAPARVIETVKTQCGRCDILVNNAGMIVTQPFETADVAAYEREITINLLAPLRLTHALYPLLQQVKGKVITVVSMGGQLPQKECPGYCASKFGLRGLMLSLALREPTTGVSVSVVNPASIDTPMVRHEALHGGSPLNFLDPPHPPSIIGEAVAQRALQPRVESEVPARDGWAVRFVMMFPGLFSKVQPWFEAKGERGRQRYLRERGLVELARQIAAERGKVH